MNSNNGDNINDREATSVQKKAFQITSLLCYSCIGEIYAIRFKDGLIRPFYIIFDQFKRAVPEGTSIPSKPMLCARFGLTMMKLAYKFSLKNWG